jgi:peroxiredoxin/glutaredoxin
MKFEDKTGSMIPFVTFKIREDYNWVSRSTDDYFKHKKVVVFALPGAFTPTCSSVHLPSYDDLYPSFRALGIDDVICLSVNDSFVMNEWKKKENVRHVTMLPDGNGEFTDKMGFLIDKTALNLGMRSWRYSMLVEDRKITKMFIEPDEEGDPYGQSSAEKILLYIDPHGTQPLSVTLFSRRGCLFCARARELLGQHKIFYEELFLHENYSIKTLKAVSGHASFPQVFINGEKIGGIEELETYLSSQRLPLAG